MKLKRLLTAALSAVMALSVCALPAMAEGSGTGTATTPYTTSTIDKNKTGSITIYKRAEVSASASNPEGKGEFVEHPNGETLANAGFSIYKVLGSSDLVEYYDGLSTGTVTEVTVDSCFNDTSSHTAGNLKNSIKTAQIETEKFTDTSEGKVVFNNLPVGLYLVIETTSPAAVTKKVDPFLISIPMTRIGAEATEATNKNLESWLYDVTVYPKNSIAKGNVTLKKVGVTGTQVANLNGVTFELYKKNDIATGYSLLKTQETVDGTITFENLTKGSYYLKETGYSSGNDKGYILNTDGKFAFDVDENGKVAASTDSGLEGKVTDGSFVINADNATITVKNYRPDIEKTVTKRDNTTPTHEADYGIGDAVPYTLTIDVPANVDKLKTFKVVDTTDVNQLKHIESDVVVKGTTASNSPVEFEEGIDYSLAISGSETMTIDFATLKSNKFKSIAGGQIVITYTAEIQSGAAIAGNGNSNTATLVYSRKTDLTTEEGNQPYEITDKGVVYTFGLNIHKTAKGGSENGKGLNGVTFDLYKDVSTETANAVGKYIFCGSEYGAISGTKAVELGLASATTEKWILVKTLTTTTEGGEAGYVHVSGLPAGTYKLVETKTVDGYNLLSKPVDAKLYIDYATTWTNTNKYDEHGNLVKCDTNTTTYKKAGTDEIVTPGETIKIVNRAGFNLPVTGGFGTLLFSGIGVLLVLAGVSVLFSLKKKNNRA